MALALKSQMKGPGEASAGRIQDKERWERWERPKRFQVLVFQKDGHNLDETEKRTEGNKETGGSQGAERGVAEMCSREEGMGHFLNTYYMTDTLLGQATYSSISFHFQENQQPKRLISLFYR